MFLRFIFSISQSWDKWVGEWFLVVESCFREEFLGDIHSYLIVIKKKKDNKHQYIGYITSCQKNQVKLGKDLW